MTPADTSRLSSYDKHMDRIRASTVAKDGIPHHAQLEWNDIRKTIETSTTFDENAFFAFCVLFRPLWMQHSPQNFYGVSGILQRHRTDLKSEEANLLDYACAHWKRCRKEYVYGGIAIGTNGKAPQEQSPEHWIDLILSELHHPDDDTGRQELITSVKDLLGPNGWNFVFIFLLPNMVELLKAAMGLHEAVKGVLNYP